jgi:hypothetical protein
MTLSGTRKRLGELPPLPRSLAAFPEAFAQPHRHTAMPQESPHQPLQRTAAYREAFLPSLQCTAESLEASPRTTTAQRCFGRRTSSSYSAPRSSSGRTPGPPACRDAPRGDLQLLQCTRMPWELRLPSRYDHPRGRKNRLQQRRDHLPELEAARSRRHQAVVSPTQHHALANAATKHHETTFLGL